MAANADTSRPELAAGFRRLVVAAALAVWALVAVGGIVRVSESGLGCPDWPLCDGRVVPTGVKEPVIEFSHRATAAVSIALLVAATVWALRRYRSRRDVLVPLAAAVVLVPFQAVLGAIVVWLELPDRLVGVHFMVGMTMLALATFAAARALRPAPLPASDGFRRAALGLGAAALALVSLGAAVVTTDGMHACGEEWPGCNGGVAGGGDLAVLQVVHRFTAYAVFALALVVIALALRGRGPRLAGSAPALAAAAQIGFGVGIVLSGHSGLGHDVFRILHVAGGATVWAATVALVAVLLVPAAATVRRPAAAASPAGR
ncbi:MAG: COX15/CtaA family protein [Thermoleophilia bacterium]|nr:COX15/CtaA family protein [Thermoleophilia bacterium]